jgi:molybdenum cofactor biosynthesis protein B
MIRVANKFLILQKLPSLTPMSTQEHKKQAPKHVSIGIITVSTTRALADDKSGKWMSEQAAKQGHEIVYHQVIPDDADTIASTVQKVIQEEKPNVLLLTGGTGITNKDVTIEAVSPMFSKELTAFGSLFAQFSNEEIDSAAILSRATGGVIENTIVFCMPGSLNACKLACNRLIFPELGHLVKHIKD